LTAHSLRPSNNALPPLSLHDALPTLHEDRHGRGESLHRQARHGTLRTLEARSDEVGYSSRDSSSMLKPGPDMSSFMSSSSSSSEDRKEHTSELQSLRHLVFRLLLEKK